MVQTISISDVAKTFQVGKQTVSALKSISFSLNAGDLMFLLGSSGTGKSTVLHLIAGLDSPDRGSISVLGQDIAGLDSQQVSNLRGQSIGFVFQSYSLVPELTLLDNVRLGLIAQRMPAHQRVEKSLEALKAVEMQDHAKKLPAELSGGQQQRGAIARALVGGQAIILADEPTANLDLENAKVVISLLRKIAASGDRTVLVATHDNRIITPEDKILELSVVN